jgi:isopenicillin N synthase-like dioxygenase
MQVLNMNGEWVAAPPVPNTFVVNLGEMLQLATGGYYVATVHRVVNADTKRARLSVPYFFNPQLSAQIAAVPSALPLWDRPPAAADATNTHAGANRLLPVYGDNAFKSLARSHPRVTKRHHSDLVLRDGKFVKAPRAHQADDGAT